MFFQAVPRVLDEKMVTNEQNLVQQSLDSLKASDPAGYLRVVNQANQALNPSGNQATAQGFFYTDKAYGKVLDQVRKELGGKIDFSKESHREAIGRALIKHIRAPGGCDVNTGDSNDCK